MNLVNLASRGLAYCKSCFVKQPPLKEKQPLLEEKLYPYEGGCDAIWRSCLVKSNGDVYPCCFTSQWSYMKLGNLKEADFADIWRSSRAEQLREYSRRGQMPCPVCLVPHWRKIPAADGATGPNPTQAGALAEIVQMQLEPSTFCNGRCYMCSLEVTDKTEIDYPKLMLAMEQMSLRDVNLVGGEVFFAPHIDSFLAWLYAKVDKAQTLGLGMTSNGSLPERRIAELVRYFTAFDITFLGTSPEIEKAVSGLNFDAKLAFVKSLVRARNEYNFQGRKPLRIGIIFTIVPTNFHQIPDAITLAEEVGVDYLVYNYDGFVISFVNYFPKIAEKVREGLSRNLQKPRAFQIPTEPLVALQLLPQPAKTQP